MKKTLFLALADFNQNLPHEPIANFAVKELNAPRIGKVTLLAISYDESDGIIISVSH